MNNATFRSTAPRFLMCPPQHFAVTYSINPWMDPAAWADRGDALHASAEAQWTALHAALRASGAAVEMAMGALGMPHGRGGAQAAVEFLAKSVPA